MNVCVCVCACYINHNRCHNNSRHNFIYCKKKKNCVIEQSLQERTRGMKRDKERDQRGGKRGKEGERERAGEALSGQARGSRGAERESGRERRPESARGGRGFLTVCCLVCLLPDSASHSLWNPSRCHPNSWPPSLGPVPSAPPPLFLALRCSL